MRKLFRVTLLIFVVAGIYLGWIYYSRWNEKREFVRRLSEPKEKQDRAIVDAYGGGRLTILDFYATPASIRRGAKAQLCYSVSSSKTVRIEPPVANVWPSLGRCVEISPQKDTVYKLIAEDDAGQKKIATAEVKVR
jgi:hypothetical protein